MSPLFALAPILFIICYKIPVFISRRSVIQAYCFCADSSDFYTHASALTVNTIIIIGKERIFSSKVCSSTVVRKHNPTIAVTRAHARLSVLHKKGLPTL